MCVLDKVSRNFNQRFHRYFDRRRLWGKKEKREKPFLNKLQFFVFCELLHLWLITWISWVASLARKLCNVLKQTHKPNKQSVAYWLKYLTRTLWIRRSSDTNDQHALLVLTASISVSMIIITEIILQENVKVSFTPIRGLFRDLR